MPKREKLEDEDAQEAEELFADLPDAFKERQWKPGQSGNPMGRPPAPDGGLDAILAWAIGKETAKLLAKTLIKKALDGDLKAIMYIYDRLEGKPKTNTTEEVSGPEPILMILDQLREDEKAIEGKRIKVQLSGPDEGTAS